jgi:sirohydrochlorin cobaltochelatase
MSKKEAIASRAVVLFAHGSRDPLWRKPVESVAARLRERDASAMIACAYLELTEPDLQTAVKTLVNEGASSIRVVPMFLGVGRHAREDLPLLMTELRALYPKVVFELQQSIGEDQRLIDLIADIAMSP